MAGLYHLTIHTGHVRMSPRQEFEESSIRRVSAWIKNRKERNDLFPS
jgi:hypothetical protein